MLSLPCPAQQTDPPTGDCGQYDSEEHPRDPTDENDDLDLPEPAATIAGLFGESFDGFLQVHSELSDGKDCCDGEIKDYVVGNMTIEGHTQFTLDVTHLPVVSQAIDAASSTLDKVHIKIETSGEGDFAVDASTGDDGITQNWEDCESSFDGALTIKAQLSGDMSVSVVVDWPGNPLNGSVLLKIHGYDSGSVSATGTPTELGELPDLTFSGSLCYKVTQTVLGIEFSLLDLGKCSDDGG
jgi:hypothetical protein